MFQNPPIMSHQSTGLFKKFSLWKFSKIRTELFSDAVFAISITLLILEVKVPHLHMEADSEELMQALIHLIPKIASWFVSFFFIAVMWVQHHNILRMADKIDYGVVWINNIFLFFLCFFPFPTALMGEYPHNRPAVLLFGIVITLASVAQSFLYHKIAKKHLCAGYNQEKVLRNVRRTFLMAPLMLLFATFLSYISLWLPYVLYAIVPFFFLLPLDLEEKTEETAPEETL